MHKMGPRGPKHYIFGDHFYSKNAKKLRFHVFLHSNARKHMILSFYLMMCKKLWICSNLVRVPRDPQLEQNSCEFGLLQVKWWCHMFSNMKYEEYLESDLPGIIRLKVVAKNILLGSLGTQHRAVFAMWCHFLKKHTNFLNQTVALKCFPC